MLKAVIDTNIIISGTISPSGAPYEILEAWRNRKFMLVTSGPILKEVERVFNYPRIKSLNNLKEKPEIVFVDSPDSIQENFTKRIKNYLRSEEHTSELQSH